MSDKLKVVLTYLRDGLADAEMQQLAADEIDHLQAEAAGLSNSINHITSALRAANDTNDRLRAELDALRGQEPSFWYLPAEDDDGEDALLLPCRDGTSPSVGALPLYAAPVATPAPVATTDERIKKEVAFFREQVTKQWKPSPYGEALPAPWMFLSKACDYIEQVSAAPVAQVPEDAVRDYPEGWVFHSADFSMNASCKSRSGSVTLVRDIAGRAWWLSLSEEDKERTPLYVCGSGGTISDAIKDAALAAAQAQEGK